MNTLYGPQQGQYPQQFGAPPQQQFGAPPQQQFGAAPQQQFAPQAQQFGGPPQQFGAFPTQPMTQQAGMMGGPAQVLTSYADAVDFTNSVEWVDFGVELPTGEYEVVVENVPKKPSQSKPGAWTYHFQLAVMSGEYVGSRPLIAIGADFSSVTNVNKVFTAYRSAGYSADWIKANVKEVRPEHFVGKKAYISVKARDPNDPKQKYANNNFLTPEQYAKIKSTAANLSKPQAMPSLQQQAQQPSNGSVPAMPLPGLPGVAPMPSGSLSGLL